MRRAFPVLLVLFLAPSLVHAGVEVRSTGGGVDVSAVSAPLSEVLDGIARVTKMKVIYDGGTPRVPVTVTLRGQTPAQAVMGVLEGLGLNFALVLDRTGTRVDTLMMVGASRTSGGSSAAGLPDRLKDRRPPAAAESPAEEEPQGDSEISAHDEGILPADPTVPATEKAGEEKPAVPVLPMPGPLNPVGFPGSASPFAPTNPAGGPGSPVNVPVFPAAPVPTPSPDNR